MGSGVSRIHEWGVFASYALKYAHARKYFEHHNGFRSFTRSNHARFTTLSIIALSGSKRESALGKGDEKFRGLRRYLRASRTLVMAKGVFEHPNHPPGYATDGVINDFLSQYSHLHKMRHTHTHTHTHRASTITLAAHTHRGLIKASLAFSQS